MTMGCRLSVPRRVVLSSALFALAYGVVATGCDAAAQETIYIGGERLPEVEVNLKVLDALDAAQPQRKLPGTGEQSDESPLKLPPGPGAEQPVFMLLPLAVAAEPPPPQPPGAKPEPAAKAAVAEPEPKAVKTEPGIAPGPAPSSTAVVKVIERAPPPPAPLPKPATVAAAAAASPALESTLDAPAGETVAPRLAALPPAKAPGAPGDTLRIEFAENSSDLTKESRKQLELLAQQLRVSDSLRAQVKAYAGESSGSASAARRLSLSRALAVRAFLIGEGVRSTRIDVRALGNRIEGGPPERVDIVLANR
ncbi:MAG: OmpA family protein [Alphaproteobacteria bacterium]